ncbi:MAG: HAD-IA family hydrolase [Methanophagales archaeon]|nr:HAD-IA family hydrolase [Methanophagales archaeon]
MRYKTGLFDMDGTLIESSQAIVQSIKEAARITGLRIPGDNEVKGIIHLPSALSFTVLYPDKELEDFDSVFIHLMRSKFKTMIKELPKAKMTLELLREKGLKIGIVTTKDKVSAEETMRDFHFPCDVLLTFEDTERTRPDPEPLLKAIKLLDSTPAQTFYCGDTPPDIIQGRRAGVKAIGLTTGLYTKEELEKENPDFIFDTIEAVLTIL